MVNWESGEKDLDWDLLVSIKLELDSLDNLSRFVGEIRRRQNLQS